MTSAENTYQTILLDVSEKVARLTFNRPDRLNSFTELMFREISDGLRRVAASDARVLIITGAGRGFCAGQDLGDRAVSPGGDKVDLGDSLERNYNPLVRTLTAYPIPVIAAVNGVAAGAGANIAIACDLVIAARSASFVQPFCRLGLLPDSGGCWTLPRMIGNARTLGLTLLGDKLPAEQAAQWGMIWRCVDDVELEETVNSLARQLASAPTMGLVHTRDAIRNSWKYALTEHLDHEREIQRKLGQSQDYAEGVAAFIEKRTPQFLGK